MSDETSKLLQYMQDMHADLKQDINKLRGSVHEIRKAKGLPEPQVPSVVRRAKYSLNSQTTNGRR